MENARSFAIITSVTSMFFQSHLISELRIWWLMGVNGNPESICMIPKSIKEDDVFIPWSNLLIYLTHRVIPKTVPR